MFAVDVIYTGLNDTFGEHDVMSSIKTDMINMQTMTLSSMGNRDEGEERTLSFLKRRRRLCQ